MKKNYLITGIAILLVFIIGLVTIFYPKNKGDEELRTIKVAEVTHSPFYTPLYVAIENNYFERQGIKIELILTSGANNVAAAVLSGDTEIGFCGPEASIYVYNEGVKDYLQTFAGLTKRDGQFIVSRTAINNFKMQDLEGKEVLGGRAGGMPILNFMTAVKNTQLTNVKINDSVDFANLTSAFLSGEGDFVNLFEPNATKLEKLGFGYVVASIGAYANEVPYTAFNAKKSFINNNSDLIEGFRKAINQGIEYTRKETSATIAKVILKQFPDTSLNDLTTIIDRYKTADSWQEDTYISEKSFNNLVEMMIDGDFIKESVPYKALIINE